MDAIMTRLVLANPTLSGLLCSGKSPSKEYGGRRKKQKRAQMKLAVSPET